MPGDETPPESPKKDVISALQSGEGVPYVPKGEQALNLPVTANDVYYLQQRWAYLEIWNADDPSPKGDVKIIKETEDYYVGYRGSCYVVAPKDLASLDRGDIGVAQDVVANIALPLVMNCFKDEKNKLEVKGWNNVELGGFDKLVRKFWVAAQDKGLKIIGFNPAPEDIYIYTKEKEAKASQTPTPRGPEKPSGGGGAGG